MSSLMFCCPQNSISAIFEKRVTDGPTHGRTDGPTDKASYRVACPQLKTYQMINMDTGDDAGTTQIDE